MPDVVGTAVVRIEVDRTAADADINKFVADTDAKMKAAGTSGGKSLGDGVTTGANKGDTAVQKLNADLDKTKTKAESAGGKNKGEGMGVLLTTALALGPALVPLGAVAAAGFGAVAIGAGTAALAVKGITAEIKTGTDQGKEYSAGLATLNSGLTELETTAATGLLAPFEKTVGSISAQFPQLNSLVAQFSTIVGTDAQLAIHGLLGGFIQLEPLFTKLGLDSESLFADFDKFANGGGLRTFANYAVAELPQVEATLEGIGTAVINLIKGLEPLGGASLTELELLAKIINSLSPDEIEAIAAGITAWAVATKALGLASTAATAIGGSGKGTAGLAASLTGVSAQTAGVIGIAVAVDQIAANATHSTSAVQGLSQAISDASQGKGAAALSALGSIGQVNLTPGGVAPNTNAINTPFGDKSSVGSNGQLTQLSKDTNQATTSLSQLAAAQLDVNAAYQASLNSTAGISAYNDELETTNTTLQAAAANAAALTQAPTSDKDITNIGTLQVSTEAYNKALSEANGNQQVALTLIEQATTQTPAYAKAIANAAAQQELLNSDLTDAASKTGLTTDQVTTYAGILGITGQKLATGAISSSEFTGEIQELNTQMKNANPSVQALEGALATFSKSEDTANDKAQLLGAVLVSSQGDALSYVGALADGYAATTTLTQAFASQQQQIKDGTLTYADSEKAAISFGKAVDGTTTASIDYTKVGAGPLINQLDQMQSSAEAAAEAVYQHEVSTKGDNQALQDAQTLFEGLTGGALVANAKQLGLTAKQAQGLATSYFNVPTNLTTQVQSIGLNDINTTLDQIGQQLGYLTGHPFQISAVLAVATIVAAASTSSGKAGIHGTNANGSITEFYANGGTSESHIAQIAPASQVRIWAEPETGGEAYIPLAPAKRSRSTAIWQETGKRLGANFADGGFALGGLPAGTLGLGDLVDALNAIAARPISVQVNGREIARAANNGNLTNGRGN